MPWPADSHCWKAQLGLLTLSQKMLIAIQNIVSSVHFTQTRPVLTIPTSSKLAWKTICWPIAQHTLRILFVWAMLAFAGSRRTRITALDNRIYAFRSHSLQAYVLQYGVVDPAILPHIALSVWLDCSLTISATVRMPYNHVTQQINFTSSHGTSVLPCR